MVQIFCTSPNVEIPIQKQSWVKILKMFFLKVKVFSVPRSPRFLNLAQYVWRKGYSGAIGCRWKGRCETHQIQALWSFGFPASAASFGPSAEPTTRRRALIQSKGNGREVWVTVWVTVWWGIWRYLLDIHHFTSLYVKKESFLNCKLQIWMSKMSRRWCSSSDTKGQLPGWPFAVSPYPLLHLLDLLQDICDIPNPGGLILDRGFLLFTYSIL